MPSSKRTKTKKQNARSNVHILPTKLSKQTHAKSRPELKSRKEKPLTTDFDHFAKRLDEQIGNIEKEISESLEFLEDNVQKSIKKSRLEKNEKEIKEELSALSQQLENRIHTTLQNLSLKEAHLKLDNERLEAIKKLSSQLIQMLSFDFYKDVLDRLGNAEFEEEVDPFGMDRHMVQKIRPVFDFLYHKYWRVTTTGINNIPDNGRALIVANHSGTLPYDGAMIKTAILNEHPKRKDARFLVENFVYHMPIMGTFMYRIGGVRACPENAELLLNSEHLVIVFPEGVKGIGKYYNQRYQLQRFGRGGFIKLCMKTQSPLIPVGVIGAEEIHPIIFKSNTLAKTIGVPYIPITPTFPLLGPLGCIPLPTKWAMHFGEPIDFSKYGKKAIDDELLVHRLSEQVRGEIQSIIKDLLAQRQSIWHG